MLTIREKISDCLLRLNENEAAAMFSNSEVYLDVSLIDFVSSSCEKHYFLGKIIMQCLLCYALSFRVIKNLLATRDQSLLYSS